MHDDDVAVGYGSKFYMLGDSYDANGFIVGQGTFFERRHGKRSFVPVKTASFDAGDGPLVRGPPPGGSGAVARAALGRRGAPRLSRYHLFDAAADALAFRETADARVPEHAPFFVYAIHLVAETDATLAPARSTGDLGPTVGI